MGLIDNYINKRVATVLASRQANTFEGFNANNFLAFINSGLPALNADTYDYYDAYSTIGAVYEVVTLLANKIQNCPLVFYRVKDRRKAEKAEQLIKSGNFAQGYVLKQQAIEEIDAPKELRDLLAKPNPYQDGKQFVNTLAQCFLLRGNCFMYGNKVSGKPKELFLFPEMEIITRTGEYYDPILGYRVDSLIGLQDFDKDDIYHFKTANPVNIDSTYQYLYGVSPLRAYLEPLRALKEGDRLSSTTLKTGGVYGAVSPKNKEDQFSKEQREAFKQSLIQAKGSNEELARLFAASIALDYTQFGLAPADLQLLETLKLKQEQIYKAYHVPVGLVSTDGNTLNNRKEFNKEVVFNGVVPFSDPIGYGLTQFVGKPYGNIEIKLDYTQLAELSGVLEEVSAYLRPLVDTAVISPNEARVALGYGEIDTDEMKGFYYKGRKLGDPLNGTNLNTEGA